jgi:hypothetical protein
MLTLPRLLALYRRSFRDPRRERMFLASLCFFVAFALTRLTTHHLRASATLHAVVIHGTHVHHLVWGIVLLLGAGYLWLVEPRDAAGQARFGRLISIVYAVGAALTLDEFALWLNLRDVYWAREGRASIDAVMLFGALVSAGLWGGPFVRALGRPLLRPWLRRLLVAPLRAGVAFARRVRARLASRATPVPPLHGKPPAGREA